MRAGISRELTVPRALVVFVVRLAFRLGLWGEGEGPAIVTGNAIEAAARTALTVLKDRCALQHLVELFI